MIVGEHVDVSDLGLVGASLKLVQTIKETGKPTIVVFISGRTVSEPWIAENADAIVQQFYPGEMVCTNACTTMYYMPISRVK